MLNRTEYADLRTDEQPLADDGVQYEPRAWWQTVSIDSSIEPLSGGTDLQGRVVLDRDRFRNGSRHKLVFTHVLIAPVNYLLQEFDTTPVDAVTYDNCGSIISKIDWLIAAPRRAVLSSRDIGSSVIINEPTWGPDTRYDPAGFASSLFGVSRWTFDKPYWLPRLGRIAFELSSLPQTAADVGLTAPDVLSSVCFDERWPAGNRFRRHGRFRERLGLGYATPAVPATLAWPGSSQDFPPDGFPTVGPIGTQGMWSPTGVWQSRDWKRGEADRGAERTWYTGFSVLIDQIAHDQHVQTAATPNVAGSPVTPFHNRLACRCKTTNGGTGEWWWQPGAPVSLVCPTLTPAHVYRLTQPIMIMKGESLRIEVQAPLPNTIGATVISPRYNVGLSLAGYAVVEG